MKFSIRGPEAPNNPLKNPKICWIFDGKYQLSYLPTHPLMENSMNFLFGNFRFTDVYISRLRWCGVSRRIWRVWRWSPTRINCTECLRKQSLLAEEFLLLLQSSTLSARGTPVPAPQLLVAPVPLHLTTVMERTWLLLTRGLDTLPQLLTSLVRVSKFDCLRTEIIFISQEQRVLKQWRSCCLWASRASHDTRVTSQVRRETRQLPQHHQQQWRQRLGRWTALTSLRRSTWPRRAAQWSGDKTKRRHRWRWRRGSQWTRQDPAIPLTVALVRLRETDKQAASHLSCLPDKEDITSTITDLIIMVNISS